ncbi:MAG: S8 family serine peptidase [Planctomycetes bacterium]|nr:S8 family serine peptidase [Planctomycetota bacterium]
MATTPQTKMLLAGLFMAGFLAASVPAAAQSAGDSGRPFPAPIADQSVHNLRYVEVPGSDVRLALWEQTGPSGGLDAYYAISLDGGGFDTVRKTSYQVHLRYASFDPLRAVPAVPDELVADASADEQIYLVQFVTQPLDVFRADIRALGGVVYKFIADHTHLVRMTSAVRDQVSQLPYVRWIGPYHPAYRMEEYLLEHRARAAEFFPRQRYNIMVFEAGTQQKDAVAERIAALGGEINMANAGKFLLEATLAPEQLFEVVRWNEVLFVDRWSPYTTDMDVVREIGGANYIETVGGFTGTGVRGEIIDLGFNTSHVDFQSRPLILHTAVSQDSHGAACSGICFGDGTGNAQARGMLPDGQGIVADWDVVSVGQARYDHTGELVADPYYAVFQTASVGSAQTTQYTNVSADTDAALFDFDILHCQSQSNLGNQNSRPQAWAKNIVACGGIYHYDTLTKDDDRWSHGASIGPAADGRIKPDLCHFYDNIFTTYCCTPTSYTSSFGGTSGATPIVAGHFGLFFQMWAAGTFGNDYDPQGTVFENRSHMTTAKAALINTASQYPFPPATDIGRFQQGWGMPDLQHLYDMRESLFVVDEEDILTNLDTITYYLTVLVDEPALRVTMTYADPPGVPGASVHRINDLTLKVTAPSGDVYWGNNGLTGGHWSTPGGSANTVDTVENVFVQDPVAGAWIVEVIASEINEDGHVETPQMDADFALVVSGAVAEPPALQIRLPGGLPQYIAPGQTTDIDVQIIDGQETYVPGTALLHYRFDSGDLFSSVPMTPVGGVDFVATLPRPYCDDIPEFYFSAEGDGGTVVYNPSNAPDGTYTAEVGEFITAFTDAFDTDPGWTTQAAWAFGQPSGGGGEYGGPDPTSGHTGNYVYGYNLSGDYDNNMPERHLTSTPIDCTGLTNMRLKFWRWLGVEQALYDHAYVRVSNDGTNWATVWENGGEIADTGWVEMDLDISAIADDQPAIYLRWTMGTTDGGWRYCGWNIDDLELVGFICETPYDVGDLNCDGLVDGFDIDPFVLVMGDEDPYDAYYTLYPDCDHMLADINGDDSIDGFDIDAFVELLKG